MKKIVYVLSLLFAISACGGDNTTFENNAYQLRNAKNGAEITLGFDGKDKRFFGRSAINRYFGTYKTEGNKLTFGRVYSTFTEESNKNNQAVSDLIHRTETIESDYVTNDTITSITEDVYSRIDQSAEEILSEVGSSYVTSDDFREELSTSLTQTAEGWEMEFNEFRSWVEETNGENQTAFEELRKYIRFIEGNIILGDQDNDLQCIITNSKISFEQNGTEVAYISNNKLYITNAEVLDRFTVGNPSSGYFDWIPRANGNLGMKWRAG